MVKEKNHQALQLHSHYIDAYVSDVRFCRLEDKTSLTASTKVRGHTERSERRHKFPLKVRREKTKHFMAD